MGRSCFSDPATVNFKPLFPLCSSLFFIECEGIETFCVVGWVCPILQYSLQ